MGHSIFEKLKHVINAFREKGFFLTLVKFAHYDKTRKAIAIPFPLVPEKSNASNLSFSSYVIVGAALLCTLLFT